MTILITGSTGKLGSALITLLQSTHHPILAATRRTPPPASLSSVPTVHFDWTDETTWPNPFTTATITKIFLLSPTVPDPAPLVNKFITYATHHSVARFVLMASASAQKGGPMFGQMWSHLATTGVPYALVGPSWVDENFLDARYVAEIKGGKIYSGMGEGRAPWVAARDVAGVSLWALTVGEEELRGRENVVVATRERITMGEIADTFTKVLGRKIEHVSLSKEENMEYLLKLGYPKEAAGVVVWIEDYTKQGAVETVPYEDVETLIGRPMVKFEDWVEEKKAAWL